MDLKVNIKVFLLKLNYFSIKLILTDLVVILGGVGPHSIYYIINRDKSL